MEPLLNYRKLAEKAFIKNLITNIYPSGIVSVVADSFDFWAVITEIASSLKSEILARTPNEIGLAKVVFRPDSGDPVKILTGYKVGPYFTDIEFSQNDLALFKEEGCEAVCVGGKYYPATVYQSGFWLKQEVDFKTELSKAEIKGAVECLWEIFGGTTTDKGYKTLHERVGLIYGDSITIDRATEILERLAEKGFASNNCVFGIGSYSYQYNTRDTHGFAMKATYGVVNGESREIYKDPATDSGTKKSAKGLLCVDIDPEENDFCLKENASWEEFTESNLLQPVFRNGSMVTSSTLYDIRKRANP